MASRTMSTRFVLGLRSSSEIALVLGALEVSRLKFLYFFPFAHELSEETPVKAFSWKLWIRWFARARVELANSVPNILLHEIIAIYIGESATMCM